MARRSPWDRPNPKKRTEKLSTGQKKKARLRARRRGRRYPNLVDNMWAAKQRRR